MKLKALLAGSLALALSAASAHAQSSPNWTYKQVPTVAQWNAAFAVKQDVLGYVPLNSAGGVMLGRLVTAAPSAATAGLNLTPGSAPASPANGDIWTTSAGLFVRANGSTIGPLISAGTVGIIVGTTPITGAATNGYILYNNAGVTGNLATTGSGNAVLATSPAIASPTFSGTVAGAGTIPNSVLVNSTLTLGSSTLTLGAATTSISGLTLASPVFSGTVSGAGTIPNSVLANASTTVNGTTCTLGSTCTIVASAGSITVGTTGVLGGSTGRILYDNAGTLGEIATTGSGNAVLATSPTIASPTFSGTVAGAGTIPNAVLVNSTIAVNGTTCTLGSPCAPVSPLNIGTSVINSGSNGFILYNNAGILGNLATTGTGNAVLATSPTISAPSISGGTHTAITSFGLRSTAAAFDLKLASTEVLTADRTLTVILNDAARTMNLGGNFATAGPLTTSGAFGITLTATALTSVTLPTTGTLATLAGTETLTGKTISGSSNTLTNIGNSSLTNSSTTVNGTSCTLGSSCTATAAAGTLTGTALNATVVTSSLTSVGTIGTGTWNGSIVALAYGGTNTALTASNGGIVYSDASGLQILAGTSTAGLCVLSQTNSAPVWGSCSGAAAVSSVTSGTGTLAISPTTGSVVADIDLSHANTWTGVQTYNNSSIRLLGSSTGYTTLASANASASNYTLTLPAVTANITYTVASGAKALATGAIASGACTAAQTDTATGAATSDAVSANFSADPTAVTGYTPSTSGMLAIIPWVTSNTINFKVCNNTSASITPGAVTVNWRITR